MEGRPNGVPLHPRGEPEELAKGAVSKLDRSETGTSMLPPLNQVVAAVKKIKAKMSKGGSEKPSLDRVGTDGFSMKGNPIPIFVKVSTARQICENLKRTHDAAGS